MVSDKYNFIPWKAREKIYMGGLALMVISQKKWELSHFFMSTLGIVQPHMKSFSDLF